MVAELIVPDRPRGVALPGWLLGALPEITGAELKLLLYVAHRTAITGHAMQALPVARLMRGTGLTKKTVVIGVHGLRDKGLLTVVYRGGSHCRLIGLGR